MRTQWRFNYRNGLGAFDFPRLYPLFPSPPPPPPFVLLVLYDRLVLLDTGTRRFLFEENKILNLALYYYYYCCCSFFLIDSPSRPLICRTVGNQVVMDPMLICKKTRRLRGKMADICRKEPSLLKEIARGVQVGTKECQYQFRNRRWNCTTIRRSLRKILLRGKWRNTNFESLLCLFLKNSIKEQCSNLNLYSRVTCSLWCI